MCLGSQCDNSQLGIYTAENIPSQLDAYWTCSQMGEKKAEKVLDERTEHLKVCLKIFFWKVYFKIKADILKKKKLATNFYPFRNKVHICGIL